jgi:hypothetical protein
MYLIHVTNNYRLIFTRLTKNVYENLLKGSDAKEIY